MSVNAVYRRTWAEIDLDAVASNFKAIKAPAGGARLCCVVKADAYGHGAPVLAGFFEELGADMLAVSNIEEAIQLSQREIQLPILILGYTPVEAVPLLAKHRFIQCIYSLKYAQMLSQRACAEGFSLRTHLKLDTGMGRLGFCAYGRDEQGLAEAVEAAKLPALNCEGVFTHFATADMGENGRGFTDMQYRRFCDAIAYLKAHGVDPAEVHAANSAALLYHPNTLLTAVRAGILLYGLFPSKQLSSYAALTPCMSLKSVISQIKHLKAGDTVSYGCTYAAKGDMTVATVPVGYADGFPRTAGEHGYKLRVNGMLCPIIGRVCMDQLMIDVTGLSCDIGDEVLIFGNDPEASADRLAESCGMINYEVICAISKRVPRAYLQSGTITAWQDMLGE